MADISYIMDIIAIINYDSSYIEEDKQVTIFHLIVFKSPVHIKVTSVGGQYRKIEAFKSKSMELKQKPGNFIWQHG